MKHNTQALLALLLLCATHNSSAQNTNVFPDNGNVGIGTTTPASTLSMFKFQEPGIDLRYQHGGSYGSLSLGHTSGFGGELALYSFGGNYNGTGVYRAYSSYVAGGYQGGLSIGAASSTGNLYFYAGGESDAHERMRITNTGYIGIGTSTPSAPLDVAGTVNISAPNAPSVLKIDAHYSTTNMAKIIFTNTDGGGDFKIAGDGGDVQWQGGGSRQLQMGAFHGIVLMGARATTTDIPFEGGTGAAFNTKVRNSSAASVGLIVQGAGSQAAALQQWQNSNGEALGVVSANGDWGIGAPSLEGYKLAVNGDAIFTKVKVKLYSGWPDYVFENSYRLPSLKEVEAYIKQHKHLPGVVSQQEVEKDGLDVAENQAALLKKIEEMTLYMIEMKKQLDSQQKHIAELEKPRAKR